MLPGTIVRDGNRSGIELSGALDIYLINSTGGESLLERLSRTQFDTDCVVVGASFAGLASALALARAGLRVTVLEKKIDPGAKLHTTGIIVKDAVDQIALLDALPTSLVRRISGVRLYAPNLRHVDLEAPGYYFLATATPAVMRWLAGEAERAGTAIAYGTVFTGARRLQSGFEVEGFGTTRFLIGADGPRSRVASALGLGASKRFLAGVEYEYAGAALAVPDKLHCFVDRRLARGYIGWVFAGVDGVQAGLARSARPARSVQAGRGNGRVPREGRAGDPITRGYANRRTRGPDSLQRCGRPGRRIARAARGRRRRHGIARYRRRHSQRAQARARGRQCRGRFPIRPS